MAKVVKGNSRVPSNQEKYGNIPNTQRPFTDQQEK